MTRQAYFQFIAGAPIRAGTSQMSQQFMMGPDTSVLAKLDETVGTDPPQTTPDPGVIQFVIQTGRTDLGTQLYKFISRTEVVGDVVSGMDVDLRYSDDDHQTFSASRTVSMGLVRPRFSQNGRSRRRIFRVGNLSCERAIVGVRLEALELFVYGGHAG